MKEYKHSEQNLLKSLNSIPLHELLRELSYQLDDSNSGFHRCYELFRQDKKSDSSYAIRDHYDAIYDMCYTIMDLGTR